MGKPKSTLKRIFVDDAKAAHKCRRNKEHPIIKGDRRFNVKEGRSVMRYCLPCARISLQLDIESLTKILSKIAPVSKAGSMSSLKLEGQMRKAWVKLCKHYNKDNVCLYRLILASAPTANADEIAVFENSDPLGLDQEFMVWSDRSAFVEFEFKGQAKSWDSLTKEIRSDLAYPDKLVPSCKNNKSKT